MATEFINNQEDENKDQEQQPGQSAPVTQGAGGAPSAAPRAPVRQQQGSGRSVNLRKYIDANSNANLAGGIENKTQQQAQNLQSGIQQQKNQFSQSASPLEQNLGEQGQNLIQTSFKNPQELLNQQDQLKQFQSLRDQGYQGQIQGLSTDVSQQQSAAQNLANQANLANTESGRYQLLRQTYGQPSYSTGQQRLDQLLLQASPNQSRTLQSNLQNIAGQAGTDVQNLSQELQARKSALEQLSGQRAQDIQNLFSQGTEAEGIENDLSNQGYQDIQTAAQNQLEALKQNAPQQYEQIQQALRNNQMNTAEGDTYNYLKNLKNQLGSRNIYNLNLENYLTTPEALQSRLNNANAEQTLTSDQYARLSALSQLAGVAGPSITQDQVGQFNPYDFDVDRFQADRQAAQQRADQLSNTINPAFEQMQKVYQSWANDVDKGNKSQNWRLQHQYQPILNAISQYQSDPSGQNLQGFFDAYKKAFPYGTGVADFADEKRAENALNVIKGVRNDYMTLDPTRQLFGNEKINYTPEEKDKNNLVGTMPIKG